MAGDDSLIDLLNGLGPELVEGDRVDDKYEIVGKPTVGGMGAVYRALDLRFGREVALKTLLPMTAGRRTRFLDEVSLTGKLEHRAIVVAHDTGVWEGLPYLILEYLEGTTLRQRLAEGEPPTVEDGLDVMDEVLDAIVYTHEREVLHCDISTNNIMWCRDGHAKLIDFGLAAALSKAREGSDAGLEFEVTSRAAPTGTRPYIAPEVARGMPPTVASEIFSLGMVLSELLLGQLLEPAPDGSVAAQLRGSHRVSDAIADVVLRATHLDSDHRYETAAQLRRALSAARRRPDSDAAPDNPYRHLRRFTTKDADWFFGRESAIRELSRRVDGHPVVAVTGPSGAGKSSLVRAGLLARLEQSVGAWTILSLEPGRDPLTALFQALCRQCGEAAGRLTGGVGTLRSRPFELGQTLRDHVIRTGRRVMVFVDQYEQLHEQDIPEADRLAFSEALDSVVQYERRQLRVVVTCREDALNRLTDSMLAGRLNLGPPSPAQMSEALTTPARRCGFEFDRGLADEIVTQLSGEHAPLPLLQLIAHRLWERRDQATRRVTREAMVRLGSLAGVLDAHAEAVIDGLRPAHLPVARRLLVRLVRSGRPRIRSAAGLLAELASDADAAEVLDQLVAQRLLTREREGDGDVVHFIHESVIGAWKRLADWLDTDRDFVAWLEAFERQRSEGRAFTTPQLHVALDWSVRRRDSLSPAQHGFIRSHRRRRIAKISALAFITLAVLAVSVVGVLWYQDNDRALRSMLRKQTAATKTAERARAELQKRHDESRQLSHEVLLVLEDGEVDNLSAATRRRILKIAESLDNVPQGAEGRDPLLARKHRLHMLLALESGESGPRLHHAKWALAAAKELLTRARGEARDPAAERLLHTYTRLGAALRQPGALSALVQEMCDAVAR